MAGKWRDEIVLLVPAVAVFILVSSQTGFSRYFRYVVPALPFLYVAAGRLAVVIERRSQLAGILISLCLAADVVESLAVVPHSLSFFNALVGGPRSGDAHLVDSNIDWGQDLLHLRNWLDAHPEAAPLHLAYFNDFHVDPEVAGINARPVPRRSMGSRGTPAEREWETVESGWYAVSINWLRGYRHLDQDEPVYTWLRELKPIGSAGHSIYIYRVSSAEASRLNGRGPE